MFFQFIISKTKITFDNLKKVFKFQRFKLKCSTKK